MASATALDPDDSEVFSEPKVPDPVNPLSLAGYINDVIATLLEDPTATILDPASTPLVLKLCSAFAADSSTAVIFIIRDAHIDPEDGKFFLIKKLQHFL